MSEAKNGEHQMGTRDFSESFPHIETISQLRSELRLAGATETDRLFSLCPNPEDCVDVLVGDTRYLFYPRTEADDDSYRIAVESDIPVLQRATNLPESEFISAVEVPRGAKSLGRLLLAVDPIEGITIGDLFERLGHLLHEIEVRTGSLPAKVGLEQVAYYGEQDALFLVPPINLIEGLSSTVLLESIGQELEARNHNVDSATALRRFKNGMAA